MKIGQKFNVDGEGTFTTEEVPAPVGDDVNACKGCVADALPLCGKMPIDCVTDSEKGTWFVYKKFVKV